MPARAIRNQVTSAAQAAVPPKPNRQATSRGQHAAQQLDQRIARADAAPGRRAAAAQHQIAQHRNVVERWIGARQAGQAERGTTRLNGDGSGLGVTRAVAVGRVACCAAARPPPATAARA